MGCSSACQIFERFSTALEWIGKRYMPEEVIIHILDHFLSWHKHISCVNFSKTIFACQVIHTGQAFLRRLFELTSVLERPNRRVKLKRGCKDDLKVWWEIKKNTLMENVSSWMKSF